MDALENPVFANVLPTTTSGKLGTGRISRLSRKVCFPILSIFVELLTGSPAF
jgi:hypothetical protein